MESGLESTPSRVAQRLKRVRNYINVSQAEFAKAIGVSPTRYNNWERGRDRLSLQGALKINELYGTSLDFLFLNRVETLPINMMKALSESSLDEASNSSKDAPVL